MTFKSIAWKMVKGNTKRYRMYFLCNTFTVLFFFMFATVFFNEQVIAVKEVQSLKYILAIPGVALLVFTVFFIQYAHDIFIKQRKSEFGLLMSIGLSRRDISKLVVIESVLVSSLSVISGIVSGMVFSRLFFLLLMHYAGLGQVKFQMTWPMFIYSVGIYLLIYWLAVVVSLYKMMQQQHVQNIQSNQTAEIVKMKSPYFGIAGLSILIVSIVGLYITSSPQSSMQEMLYMWAFATFAGLYLCITNFTVLFIKFAKGMPSFYYRHVLFFSSIEYKMKRLSAITMLVAVMAMVTLLYGTIILFTASYERAQMIEFHPYDIAYIETEHINNIPDDELESVAKDFGVQKRLTVPIYEYYEEDYNGIQQAYSVISIATFNVITDQQKTIGDQEFIHFINDKKEFAGGFPQFEEFNFQKKTGDLLTFTIKESYIERELNYLGNSSEYIVVSEKQFAQIERQTIGQWAVMHFMNVRNWEQSGKLADALEKRLEVHNAKASPIHESDIAFSPVEYNFRIVSKAKDVEEHEIENGILFFVTAFLSVIFFIGTFVLLYLNLFADIEKEQVKYKKLYQIGIRKKEVKRIVSLEMAVLCFMPTFIGAVLALLYIIAMGRDIGGVLANPEVLTYFFILTGIYHFIQFVFYRYARRKMVKQLSGI